MAKINEAMKNPVNILLIEDDPLDQIEVQRILKKRGILFRIKIAKNGEEGMRILTETSHEIFSGKPNIILLDLNMPKMNGFEFLNALKSNGLKDLKIFVLTTSNDHDDKQAALALGASGFITKPLKFETSASSDAFNLMIDMMNI